MNSDLRRLVMDTLRNRRSPKIESCLQVNEAGIELLDSTEDALPVIEQVLRDVVIPAMNREDIDDTGFYGLSYVFGAYLVISSKFESPRSPPSLISLGN